MKRTVRVGGSVRTLEKELPAELQMTYTNL